MGENVRNFLQQRSEQATDILTQALCPQICETIIWAQNNLIPSPITTASKATWFEGEVWHLSPEYMCSLQHTQNAEPWDFHISLFQTRLVCFCFLSCNDVLGAREINWWNSVAEDLFSIFPFLFHLLCLTKRYPVEAATNRNFRSLHRDPSHP